MVKWFKSLYKQAQMTKTAARPWEKGWSYTPPNPADPSLSSADKQAATKQRIYDFYFLTQVDPNSLRNADTYGMFIGEDGWESAIENLINAKQSLIDGMVSDYIEDLRYSVSCESRHLLPGSGELTIQSMDMTGHNGMCGNFKKKVEKHLALQNSKSTVTKQIADIEQTIQYLSSDPQNKATVQSLSGVLEKLKKQPANPAMAEFEEFRRQMIVKFVAPICNACGFVQCSNMNEKCPQCGSKVYLSSPSKSWNMAKGHWTEAETCQYKVAQIGYMTRFLFDSTPEEWDIIEQKVKKIDSIYKSKAKVGLPFTDLESEGIKQIIKGKKGLPTSNFYITVQNNSSKPEKASLYFTIKQGPTVDLGGWGYQDKEKKNDSWIKVTPESADIPAGGTVGFQVYIEWAKCPTEIDLELEMHTYPPNDPRARKYTWQEGYVQKHILGEPYFQSYAKFLAAEFTNRELALFATLGFLVPSWKGSYGGPPWAEIAKGLGTLDGILHGRDPIVNEMGKTNAKIHVIDRAHAMQHNTGSAFTKIHALWGDGSWLVHILNEKANANTTILDLYEKISPKLKEIGWFYLFHMKLAPSQSSLGTVKQLSATFKEMQKKGKLCNYLLNTNFNDIGENALYKVMNARPIDWKCLAQNKFFTAEDRRYFWEHLSSEIALDGTSQYPPQYWAELYQIFYKTHKFNEDEVEKVLSEFDEFPEYQIEENAVLENESVENVQDEAEEKTGSSWGYIKIADTLPENDVISFNHSKLIGLAENPNLPSVDLYFKIFDIAQKNKLMDVLFALMKNKTVTAGQGLSEPAAKQMEALAESLKAIEIPEEMKEQLFVEDFVSNQLKPANTEWASGSEIGMDVVSEFMGDVIYKLESESFQVDTSTPEAYSENNNEYLKMSANVLSKKGETLCSVEVKQTSRFAKVTFFGLGYKISFFDVNNENSAKDIVTVLKKVVSGAIVDDTPSVSDEPEEVDESTFNTKVVEAIESIKNTLSTKSPITMKHWNNQKFKFYTIDNWELCKFSIIGLTTQLKVYDDEGHTLGINSFDNKDPFPVLTKKMLDFLVSYAPQHMKPSAQPAVETKSTLSKDVIMPALAEKIEKFLELHFDLDIANLGINEANLFIPASKTVPQHGTDTNVLSVIIDQATNEVQFKCWHGAQQVIKENSNKDVVGSIFSKFYDATPPYKIPHLLVEDVLEKTGIKATIQPKTEFAGYSILSGDGKQLFDIGFYSNFEVIQIAVDKQAVYINLNDNLSNIAKLISDFIGSVKPESFNEGGVPFKPESALVKEIKHVLIKKWPNLKIEAKSQGDQILLLFNGNFSWSLMIKKDPTSFKFKVYFGDTDYFPIAAYTNENLETYHDPNELVKKLEGILASIPDKEKDKKDKATAAIVNDIANTVQKFLEAKLSKKLYKVDIVDDTFSYSPGYKSILFHVHDGGWSLRLDIKPGKIAYLTSDTTVFTSVSGAVSTVDELLPKIESNLKHNKPTQPQSIPTASPSQMVQKLSQNLYGSTTSVKLKGNVASNGSLKAAVYHSGEEVAILSVLVIGNKWKITLSEPDGTIAYVVSIDGSPNSQLTAINSLMSAINALIV